MTSGFEFVIAAGWQPDPAGSLRWRDGARSADPVLRALAVTAGGAWVAPNARLARPRARDGLATQAVAVEAGVLDDFEHGQCDATLAPLYLDAGTVPAFRREWREAYRDVNRRIAVAVAGCAERGAAVWVHDLPLQLVPGYLRELRPDLRIGWFLNAPLPDPERLAAEPLHGEIADSLLDADVVGFSQQRSALNFAALADARRPYGPVPAVGVHPVPADVAAVEALARDPAVVRGAARLRARLGDPQAVVLAVGHPEQNPASYQMLDAYAELLADGGVQATRTSLVYVSLCADDPRHLRCDRARLDRRVAQINGVHASLGRPAVHYLHRELAPSDMVTLYLAADVLVALPLRDATTVTAKEYVIARSGGTGRLVLSEFSGEAAELVEAGPVNPNDIDAVKDAIAHAVGQAGVPDAGMVRMRHRITRHGAQEWAESFLATIRASRPRSRIVRPLGRLLVP